MISGAHAILYSTSPEADREFFRDIMKFPYVDAGEGWLIFALPPTELAIHPEKTFSHELFLTCDNHKATVKELKRKKIKTSVPSEQSWGTIVRITLPSGSKLGLYEPKHALLRRQLP